MTTEYMCGSVHKLAPSTLVSRAAGKILEYESPRAVTMDPGGRVWVDAPYNAAEMDIVGVYGRDSLEALKHAIAEDLKHEVSERGLAPAKRRYVRNAA